MVVLNKYKDFFNDFINNLDIKFLNKLKLINKILRDIFKSENKLSKARPKLKKDLLIKNL